MKIGVNLNINVKKIDKIRMVKGEKGTYLNCTVFIDTENKDDFGNNGIITQDVTKEEKEQKVKGAILGNARVFWKDDQTQQQNKKIMYIPDESGFDDNIPF